MKRQRAIRRMVTEGFGLGPFAYQDKVEKRLRKQEIPFEDFYKQINEALMDPAHPLPPLPRNFIAWLYDQTLRTRLMKDTTEFARRTLRTKSWRAIERKTANLLKLLRDYPSFDPERALRRALESRKESRTGRRAAQLEQNLSDLSHQISFWLHFTERGPWQEHYRGYVVEMDRRLEQRLPAILKKKVQRAVVISAALQAIGLTSDDSTEAILRMLRREPGKKGRRRARSRRKAGEKKRRRARSRRKA